MSGISEGVQGSPRGPLVCQAQAPEVLGDKEMDKMCLGRVGGQTAMTLRSGRL